MTLDIRADLYKQRGAIGGTSSPFSSSSSLTSGPLLRGVHTQGQNNGEKGRVETQEPTCLRCISLYNKPVSGHKLEPHKFSTQYMCTAQYTQSCLNRKQDSPIRWTSVHTLNWSGSTKHTLHRVYTGTPRHI